MKLTDLYSHAPKDTLWTFTPLATVKKKEQEWTPLETKDARRAEISRGETILMTFGGYRYTRVRYIIYYIPI